MKREIITCSNDKAFIYNEEIRLIKELNTFNDDNPEGANFTRGGEIGPRGMRHSPEAKRKMSLAHKGVPLSEEQRAAISRAHKGKPKSPEQRKKMGDAQRGRKVNRTLEHQTKLNTSQIGKHTSPETKAKISQSASRALKGRKLSPETRAKIGEASRRRKSIRPYVVMNQVQFAIAVTAASEILVVDRPSSLDRDNLPVGQDESPQLQAETGSPI